MVTGLSNPSVKYNITKYAHVTKEATRSNERSDLAEIIPKLPRELQE